MIPYNSAAGDTALSRKRRGAKCGIDRYIVVAIWRRGLVFVVWPGIEQLFEALLIPTAGTPFQGE
jgi:hypothetical protein